VRGLGLFGECSKCSLHGLSTSVEEVILDLSLSNVNSYPPDKSPIHFVGVIS
jgi:hypothetical protein